MEDCSKKGKIALRGILILLSVPLILMFREYINDVFSMFYIVIGCIISLKFMIPYVYCVMKK